jgi:hypothetical protein
MVVRPMVVGTAAAAMRPLAALLALYAAAAPAGAIDNGLGRSPPMGWRG